MSAKWFPSGARRRAASAAQNGNTVNRSLAVRWGSNDLFTQGFVGVPLQFLKSYVQLGLTNGEAMFIIHLMSFKWSEQAPFPCYKTLATRMGITSEMARRHAKSLEAKALLHRVKRIGRSNAFDLTALTQRLQAAIEAAEQKVA
jgi:hypothetical protein